MTNRKPDWEIETDGILAAYGYLLETLFISLFDRHPLGRRAAFREFETFLLDMLERRVANPDAYAPEAVQRSNETERQLRDFLLRLSSRVGSA